MQEVRKGFLFSLLVIYTSCAHGAVWLYLQAAFDDFPVYDVPQFPHVFGAAVLAVEVVGVFPHVDAVEGCHAVSHGGVAVVAVDNG